ncbi:MAG TPA: transporter [Bacteroidales bacterium]|nr:transporter [Bacteroidales bacterium]
MQRNIAGPPFLTDDPVPVPFQHWEYYISSIDTYRPEEWTGTLPHFEVNYGLIRNLQVHLLLPLNYTYTPHRSANFGYADTEIGAKYRIIRETGNRPQVGIFPIFEIPTVKNDEFSHGKVKAFVPVWAQKSWHKLTTYGGAGYQVNPGKGNKNSTFLGWELQYDFTPVITVGGELYYQTADTAGGKSATAFNLGGYFNFSDQFHIIYSFGRNITHERFFTSYFGLLWTI